MRRRASPARRRLGRIRWSITVGFAVTTASGLVALAFLTLRLDNDARERAAGVEVTGRVAALTDSVGITSDGSLRLTRFEQQIETDPPARWAVLSRGLLLVAGPEEQAVPGDRELARIVASAQTGGSSAFTAADTRGHVLVWAASAVPPGPGLDPAPGSVVLVGAPLPRSAAHADLRQALIIAAAALTLLTAAAGHLISGRAMRPAVNGLDQQEQFLTEAAHELRTPIATLQLLLEADAPTLEDRDVERRQVLRLERLLQSLLMRARSDLHGASPELIPIRLDQLATRVIGEMNLHDLRWELEPVVVWAAPQVLGLAIRNLIENADQHGRGDVHVTVRDRSLTVVDGGPGIPAGRRAVVLQRGVSGGTGTGTGLALVAWAADMHGAALTLDQTEGGGLTVRLRFPSSSPPHDPRSSVRA